MKQTKRMSQKYPKHETENKKIYRSQVMKKGYSFGALERRQYNLKLINTASFKMYMSYHCICKYI